MAIPLSVDVYLSDATVAGVPSAVLQVDRLLELHLQYTSRVGAVDAEHTAAHLGDLAEDAEPGEVCYCLITLGRSFILLSQPNLARLLSAQSVSDLVTLFHELICCQFAVRSYILPNWMQVKLLLI